MGNFFNFSVRSGPRKQLVERTDVFLTILKMACDNATKNLSKTWQKGATVWWFINVPDNGMATIDTFGSDYDTVLHVYTDFENGFGNFTLVAANDDSGGTLQSSVTFPVNAFQFYEIRVGGFFDSMGNIDLTGIFVPDGGVLLGDVNLDGVVSLLDVAPFVNRVTSGTFQAEADINGDGVVSLLDVAPFVDLLTGG